MDRCFITFLNRECSLPLILESLHRKNERSPREIEGPQENKAYKRGQHPNQHDVDFLGL